MVRAWCGTHARDSYPAFHKTVSHLKLISNCLPQRPKIAGPNLEFTAIGSARSARFAPGARTVIPLYRIDGSNGSWLRENVFGWWRSPARLISQQHQNTLNLTFCVVASLELILRLAVFGRFRAAISAAMPGSLPGAVLRP